jgi:hypothetical protein
MAFCASAAAQDLVIRDAKVFASPNAPPVTQATVLILAGKIAAVGNKDQADALVEPIIRLAFCRTSRPKGRLFSRRSRGPNSLLQTAVRPSLFLWSSQSKKSSERFE